MNGLELISFQIISAVGTARSMYIEAIELAKQGKIEEARKMIKEGEEAFVQGHSAHAELIQKEAGGESVQANLLLIHAEDQLMSAEAFQIIATQFIDLYESIKVNK
ncbi:PTS lactose/cellobiose transporter subunit IIA [Amedibacterium intestinale]|uniref:PTS lactose/cellobiose transporter subunit IIA n=1 Tax=Amedibacterium intestinale TaxID=2583452 RepID=UPI000E2082C8|nr:PTS lactose/cellobiose transporter subunit IIA [Amedibacterium intestinale]RHO31501.1 PTS lactose/cellobiose transporter subunit IIA [Erysipelotrichaceae bacterium AM17-60]BBK63053.1 PTS cellobiose transporter subunit IIA [Amedibacterium intestinale]